MRRNKLTPTPMTVREHFEHSPEFADPEFRISLAVVAPKSIKGSYATLFFYHKTDLLNHAKTIIPKLISIAGILIEDEKLGLAFRSHYNLITDYYEFVEKYNKSQQ